MQATRPHAVLLGVAKAAALEAGEFLASRFGVTSEGSFKSSHDIGLAEDKLSEEIILRHIRRQCPSHSIYSEEAGHLDSQSEYCWYVDPLDGTNNFFAKLPYFSVSIGLVRRNEIVLGVVYNPISRQFFHAVKGGGAYLEEQRLSPSRVSSLSQSVCAFERGYIGEVSDTSAPQVLDAVQKNVRRCLVMWSPALDWCLLACGGIDALVSIDSSLEDQVAGTLIAEEAGCIVRSARNTPYVFPERRIVASNRELHSQVQALLPAGL